MDRKFKASESSIVGNACLYGGTGGDLHANGRAGERFGVRNSGTYAVVEGTGDHLCEYMTGGVIVTLGSTGRNIGAGMTGGLLYAYDPDDKLDANLNHEIVSVRDVPAGSPAELQLKAMIERHLALTGSSRAKELLDSWETALPKFAQVYPPSEAKGILVAGGVEGAKVRESRSEAMS